MMWVLPFPMVCYWNYSENDYSAINYITFWLKNIILYYYLYILWRIIICIYLYFKLLLIKSLSCKKKKKNHFDRLINYKNKKTRFRDVMKKKNNNFCYSRSFFAHYEIHISFINIIISIRTEKYLNFKLTTRSFFTFVRYIHGCYYNL